MPFRTKDEVETGRRSRAKLLFVDDSVYNLGELSRLSVEKYLYEAGKERSTAVIRLFKGLVRVGVGRSDLEIHTPTAVVAARGTGILLWVEGEGDEVTTYVYVLDGEVTVTNIVEGIGGTLVLKKGMGAKVKKRLPPLRLKELVGRDIVKLKRKTIVPFIERERLRRFASRFRGLETPLKRRLIKRYLKKRIAGGQPFSQEPAGAYTPVTINIEFPEMK
ncbi:MAG: hypothetical protein D6726_06915 [Nitrospirae bacterium]|nr:MAG: hypothetical protein D6726_06915 [Nitrospirota bacterium]